MTLTQLTFVFNPTICLGYLNLQYWHQFLLSQRCYLYKIHFSSWLFKLGYLYLLLFIIIFKFTYGLYKLICKRVTRILFIKWLPSQLTYSCSKSTIETLEKVWSMFKMNNINIRTTLLTLRRCSGVFIVNFGHISLLFLTFLLLTLNK